MANVGADHISTKLKTLLDELASLQVHSVILASFTNQDAVVFGMEMNTSRQVAASLLQAGLRRVEGMQVGAAPPLAELQ